VVSALDRLGLGVAIVTGAADVIVRNEAAARILDRTTLVRHSRDGRLVCTNPDPDARLQEAVRRAAATAAGRDRVLNAPLRLEDAGRDGEILLDVTPLADAAGEIDRGLSGAVVFLIDTAHPPRLDEARFAGLYGLTGAETDVLAGLIAGRRLAEIAEERGTSLNTARNQAQSLLAKTGCTNRSDILRLVMRTLPPIIGT
jgi:DNA-binding CsgD family transcriptional regulator